MTKTAIGPRIMSALTMIINDKLSELDDVVGAIVGIDVGDLVGDLVGRDDGDIVGKAVGIGESLNTNP